MTSTDKAVEIRGNMYTLMSLMLLSTDPAAILRSLHARVQQAPEFLNHTPVIVDFSSVDVPAGYDFNLLFKVIRQQNLLPVAVRGLPENMKDQLQTAGVPIVEQNNPRAPAPSDDSQLEDSGVTQGRPGQTLLLARSLRPGERCYAPGADLIVTGDCHADNELIADGHIHVYGVLRGKVVAGFQGNRGARIFAQQILANRIAIAGIDLADISSPHGGQGPFQVRLHSETLEIVSMVAS